jgi:hypothetical protein
MFINLTTAKIVPEQQVCVAIDDLSTVVAYAMTHGTEAVNPAVWDVVRAQSPKTLELRGYHFRDEEEGILGELPPQLWTMTSLEKVVLVNVGLEDKDAAPLWTLPHLRVVNLDGNFLEKLPALVALPTLEVLSLRDNTLQSVGELSLPKVVSLDLAYNRGLEALPEVVSLPSLTHLALERTGVSRLPASWVSGSGVEFIDITESEFLVWDVDKVSWQDEDSMLLLGELLHRGVVIHGWPS